MDDAQPGGRLIVLRASNFGWNLALNLKIDGRTAANIVQGRRYDHFAPGGRSLGVLYGSALDNSYGVGVLVTIDPSNANILTSLTLVGSGNSFCAGISFDPADVLYASR